MTHDSPVGGHAGYEKTYQQAKRYLYWKGMKKNIKGYIKQCRVCQQKKYETMLPARLLQPLPIPLKPWTDISLDFIEGLPNSQGFNVILVVVDRLTKYNHFAPLKHPYTAKTVAQTFMQHVFKLHGLPQTIVSDRNPIFTSHFW